MDLFSYVVDQSIVGDEQLCHSLFLQIINTLNFMHSEKKMAHLDIKLENLVIDDHFLVKLIDFAYVENTEKRLQIAKGTERYFAPEVARIFYQRHVWHPDSLKQRPTYFADKADVFSLGILLFSMVFGQPPFFENLPDRSPLLAYLCSGNLVSAEIFFRQHELTRYANSKARISLGLKKLLVKLLAYQPEDRPSLAEVIATDEWLIYGPNRQMMSQNKYWAVMR